MINITITDTHQSKILEMNIVNKLKFAYEFSININLKFF